MKKFAKKPLAIAAMVMMVFGGGVHAKSGFDSKQVLAERIVLEHQELVVDFSATDNEVYAGAQTGDVDVFKLSMSDRAQHRGWGLAPTGQSKPVQGEPNGYMIRIDDGSRVPLEARTMQWSTTDMPGAGWFAADTGADFSDTLYIPTGVNVKPGQYRFTGTAVMMMS
ncbi:MyfA/PsaA family fimbrial adhesin [Yersinia enterocolitica]